MFKAHLTSMNVTCEFETLEYALAFAKLSQGEGYITKHATLLYRFTPYEVREVMSPTVH